MGAEDRIITAAAAGRGRLRASDSDRERVLDMLKAAFVQGRLTKDELDVRVGQTLASRTWGDLTAITEDIPAWPIPRTVRKPARPASDPPVHGVIKAIACALIALGAVTLAGLPGAWTVPAPPPPTMTSQACQMFYSWQNPATPKVPPGLNAAVATARNGSDPVLAGDLATLQQDVLRYEGLGGPPLSGASRQLNASRVQADIRLVSSDCQNDGFYGY